MPSNNRLHRTALRAAAEPERYVVQTLNLSACSAVQFCFFDFLGVLGGLIIILDSLGVLAVQLCS